MPPTTRWHLSAACIDTQSGSITLAGTHAATLIVSQSRSESDTFSRKSFHDGTQLFSHWQYQRLETFFCWLSGLACGVNLFLQCDGIKSI
jgi:hypothetical protein